MLEQPRPEGLAQAFLIAEDFIAGEPSALVLGDNIFYGAGFTAVLVDAASDRDRGARSSPIRWRIRQRFGVVEIDAHGMAVSIEEKPANPKTQFCRYRPLFLRRRRGGYRARREALGARRDRDHLGQRSLHAARRPSRRRSCSAAPPGSTPARSRICSPRPNFVQTIETRQGYKIACLEEVAWRLGYIDTAQALRLADLYRNSYGAYIKTIIEHG